MVPAPLITGTIVYLILGLVLHACAFGATATGSLSKDNGAYVVRGGSRWIVLDVSLGVHCRYSCVHVPRVF